MKELAILVLVLGTAWAHESFRVMFQWNFIDFVWPNTEAKEEAIQRGQYIAANNAIAGIKVWKNRMYLTVPRLKVGVPVTLGVTSATPVNGVTAPRLEAYPNWEMQRVGDCRAFQFVQSMEIDPLGRMWVLDTGRTEILSLEPKNKCPPRLVILNLENNGEVLRSYEFPPDVANHDTAYLNDIVLDHEDGGLAYITDNSKTDPGIIVFSLQNSSSWKIRHASMKAESEAVGFMVGKTRVSSEIHVDGIALSPVNTRERQIYYSPLSSFRLYSLPTSVLKNRTLDVRGYVKELGGKHSQTDGMMMSSKGVLYFGLLADDAVATWDSKNIPSFNTGQRVISRDHQLMQWPDSFAFDENGSIYCVTNALQNFLVGPVDTRSPNYRIVKSNTDAKSYQYYEDGRAPELPNITAGAAGIAISMVFWTSFAMLLI